MSGETFIGVLVAVGAITIVLMNPHLKEGNIANAQDISAASEATEFKKPDDAKTPQTPRQQVCAKLIDDIERAYTWDIDNGNTTTRPYLAATIQIYNGVGGEDYCRKPLIIILEDVKRGK